MKKKTINERDWNILSVEVKTKNQVDTMNLADDLLIDEANINESFCNQPSLFAWWATVAAQARAIADKVKLEVEKQDDYIRKTLTGELDVEVRQQLELNGEKVTETKVTNSIFTHKKYKAEVEKLYELKEKYLEANSNAVVLEIGRDSMNQRKDALISLGAQVRNDANNLDLSLKKEQAAKVIKASKARKRHEEDTEE